MTRQFIHPDPENEGEWITPPVAATLAAAGLLLLMTYVKTEGRYPTICRDQSDLSKMPFLHLWRAMSTSLSGGNCRPSF
jgi:hypothetical protein